MKVTHLLTKTTMKWPSKKESNKSIWNVKWSPFWIKCSRLIVSFSSRTIEKRSGRGSKWTKMSCRVTRWVIATLGSVICTLSSGWTRLAAVRNRAAKVAKTISVARHRTTTRCSLSQWQRNSESLPVYLPVENSRQRATSVEAAWWTKAPLLQNSASVDPL